MQYKKWKKDKKKCFEIVFKRKLEMRGGIAKQAGYLVCYDLSDLWVMVWLDGPNHRRWGDNVEVVLVQISFR
jgi:hypothetical protein